MTTSEEAHADNDAYIQELRARLAVELIKASNALISARKAVDILKSDAVCDAVFVEEAWAEYIEHAIQEARMFTAAAQSMVSVMTR